MDPTELNIQDLLPLREPTFYILLSLASGEKHGYAIIKTIESLSGGKLQLSTGTLYEALARLVEQRLIERIEGLEEVMEKALPKEDQRSRTRKAYRLTQLGTRVLKGETKRMQALIAMTQLHLGKETL
jgi:DNA-binding PadR family transcriptional regulator